MQKTRDQLIFNKSYKIVPLKNPRLRAGFLECIEGESADQLYDRNSIVRPSQHKHNDVANALRPGDNGDYARLMASAIGTFVSGFVLAIGDRHQGNMMLSNDHSFFNIDFGFTFGETPLLDTADFPIPLFRVA